MQRSGAIDDKRGSLSVSRPFAPMLDACLWHGYIVYDLITGLSKETAHTDIVIKTIPVNTVTMRFMRINIIIGR